MKWSLEVSLENLFRDWTIKKTRFFSLFRVLSKYNHHCCWKHQKTYNNKQYSLLSLHFISQHWRKRIFGFPILFFGINISRKVLKVTLFFLNILLIIFGKSTFFIILLPQLLVWQNDVCLVNQLGLLFRISARGGLILLQQAIVIELYLLRFCSWLEFK